MSDSERMIRVGIIVPQSNTTNEVEFHRLAPPGLSFHFARIPLHIDMQGDAHRDALMKDVTLAASHLQSCGVDLIVFGCTSDSMKYGDDVLGGLIREVAGVPAITTAGAITQTLNELGVTHISMASPYTEESNANEAAFLESAGFKVVASAGLGLNTSMERIKEMSRVRSQEVYNLAMSVDRDETEALLICCTDFNSLDAIEKLEQATGKPVISSNVATYAVVMKDLNFAGGHEEFGQIIAALPR